MKYSVYRFHFTAGVHFGNGTLWDSETALPADTLFSALCQEAVDQEGPDGAKTLAEAVECGSLRLSDLHPFLGEELYLPKPLKPVAREREGDSKVKKSFKKLHWIPASQFDTYLEGLLDPLAAVERLNQLGSFCVRTMIATRSPDKLETGDALPYSVGVYQFAAGNGLYLLAGFDSEVVQQRVETLLHSLSYSGIGGKRSAGLGRFTLSVEAVPQGLAHRLMDNGAPVMTLSVAMAPPEQLEQVLEGAQYLLQKRSGFVASPGYAQEPRRKRDFYAFCAGSCFQRRFDGGVFDVGSGGGHPVYRYAAPLWLEV